jgi:hypothetical protein
VCTEAPGTVLAVGVVLSTLGALFCAGSAYAWRVERARRRRAIVIPGRIVGTESFEDGGTRYDRVIEAMPPGGGTPLRRVPIRVVDGSYGEVTWAIGDAQDVEYDPDDPGASIPVGVQSGHRAFAPAFLAMGLAVGAIGAFLIAAYFLGPDHPFVRFGSQFFSRDGE